MNCHRTVQASVDDNNILSSASCIYSACKMWSNEHNECLEIVLIKSQIRKISHVSYEVKS